METQQYQLLSTRMDWTKRKRKRKPRQKYCGLNVGLNRSPLMNHCGSISWLSLSFELGLSIVGLVEKLTRFRWLTSLKSWSQFKRYHYQYKVCFGGKERERKSVIDLRTTDERGQIGTRNF